MTVSTTVAYVVCVLLELMILIRCVRTGLVRDYPFFWAYLFCVCAGDLAMYPASKLLNRNLFGTVFWTKEFICVIAGYAVVMEIIEKAFEHFEGPKRLGRNAALLTFVAIVGMTGFQAISERVFYTVRTSIQIEADLRGAELILLSIVIAAISYYSVPIGRNLRGIIAGYGICTAAVALNEAFRTFAGPSFQAAFSTIWSYSFLASVVIWTWTLWSRQPSPVPAGATQIDGDYETLAGRTKATLSGVLGHLRKAVRP